MASAARHRLNPRRVASGIKMARHQTPPSLIEQQASRDAAAWE